MFVDWQHLYALITASREAGLALKDVVVWAKGSRSSAANDSFYKLVLVFKNGDAVQTNTLAPGQPGRTNIWEYAAVGASSDDLASHPGAKSTALVADAISDVTGRGAIVLDPFAGTGTTIIAAEKTGRHGRAIERDPLYCDVIIRRWQQYTGKAARLALAGRNLLPTRRSIIAPMSRSPSRLIVRAITCGRPIQGGSNSGRNITTSSTRKVRIRSTTRPNTSKLVGSVQCASSKTISTGLKRVRVCICKMSASSVLCRRCSGVRLSVG